MIIAVTGLRSEANLLNPSTSLAVLCGSQQRDSMEKLLSSGCSGLVSFGIGGGLTEGLQIGDLIIATKVAAISEWISTDDKWSDSLLKALTPLGAKSLPTFSSSLVMATVAERNQAAKMWGASLSDTESYAVARYARRHALPFVIVRSVSDTINSDMPKRIADLVNPDGSSNVLSAIGSILMHPGDLPIMLKASSGASAAILTLQKALKLLTPTLNFEG